MSKLPKTSIKDFEQRRKEWGVPKYRDEWSLRGLTKKQRKRYVVEDDNSHSCSICADMHRWARKSHQRALERFSTHHDLAELMDVERRLVDYHAYGRARDVQMATSRGRSS